MLQGRNTASRIEDVHELALGMPYVKVDDGTVGNAVYQVGGKSFIFFRNPRPDAIDPQTGERYRDVIIFWVPLGIGQASAGPGRSVTVLHDPAFRRPSVGAAAGQPHR